MYKYLKKIVIIDWIFRKIIMVKAIKWSFIKYFKLIFLYNFSFLILYLEFIQALNIINWFSWIVKYIYNYKYINVKEDQGKIEECQQIIK